MLMDLIVKHKRVTGIFVIWLFNVSACIGIYLGFMNWFVEKTAINLIIQLLLLALIFPIRNKKEIQIFLIIFFIGFTVEVIGVKTGFPFGDYSYKSSLGLKLLEVPLLIGSNWVVLVFTTGAISNYIAPKYTGLRILSGATLMLLLDILMEPVVAQLNFWEFTPNLPPIENYISWFLLALFMHYLFQKSHIKGDQVFSLNLFAVQLIFFLFLNITLS